MMDLRDALNEAVNTTARAAEINNANEEAIHDKQVRERHCAHKWSEIHLRLPRLGLNILNNGPSTLKNIIKFNRHEKGYIQ